MTMHNIFLTTDVWFWVLVLFQIWVLGDVIGWKDKEAALGVRGVMLLLTVSAIVKVRFEK